MSSQGSSHVRDREADLSPQKLSVPFISRWSGERDEAMPMILGRDGRGIRYADERAYDRDEHGVLWSRSPSRPGRGKPQFGKVHSLRQRITMAGLRCQICGGPADRTAEGVLWLIDANRKDLNHDGEYTAHPPVCRPCAHRSVHACPHLRLAVTAVRVRDFTAHGVNGVLYGATHAGPAVLDAGHFTFGDPRMRWVRAYQLTVRLRHYTVIDLDSAPP